LICVSSELGAVSVSLGIGAFQMADAECKRTLVARSNCTAALVTMDKVETRGAVSGGRTRSS
jgi:hypothetical protein